MISFPNSRDNTWNICDGLNKYAADPRVAATRWTVRHATQSEVGYLLSGLWKGRARRTTERGAKREGA